MSIFYILHINTPLSVNEVEQLIGTDTISQDILNIDVYTPSSRSMDIFASAFPFRANLRISYNLIPGNHGQSIRTMITTVVQLLTYDQSDLVLLYNGDVTSLQRIQSTLILNERGFWNPDYRALVPLPYTIELLPLPFD